MSARGTTPESDTIGDSSQFQGSGGELALAKADGADRDTTMELGWKPAHGPWRIEVGSEYGWSSAELVVGRRLIVGSAKEADVRIADPAVSARHCSVEASPTGIWVQDLGSRNGVFVGAARVNAGVLTGDGSSVVIGRSTLTIRCANRDDVLGECASVPGLIGRSWAMRRIAAEVRRHASLRAPVLIQGESGTGKDVVARALHTLSRRTGRYVPLNVGALTESLADAELFGHRRGAFTGAVSSRAGAFEQAHCGTLFLDEIAELSMPMQVKLLRVVEDGVVRPLGAVQPLEVDVRIVSATWAPLEQRIAEARFRQDLYHRISTVVIRLPPLRDRKSDIPELCTTLLQRSRAEFGPKQLTPRALARLTAHDWPGNVRELGAVLYRAAAGSTGETIDAQDLEMSPSHVAAGVPALSPAEAALLLKRHGGNVSAAARAARVARSTFRSWLSKQSRSQLPLFAADPHKRAEDQRRR